MIKKCLYALSWTLFLFLLLFEVHAVNYDLNIFVTETGSQNKRRMSQEEFDFIDTSMKRYDNPGTGSDFPNGLVQMLEMYNVSFSYDCVKKLWTFDLGLKDINQIDSQLTMDGEGKVIQIFKITSVSPAQMVYPDESVLIPTDWDDEGLANTPVPTSDLKPLRNTIEQPQLRGGEASFDDQDKTYLSQALQGLFDNEDEDALERLEKEFFLNRKPAKNAYHIMLRMKKLPSLVGNIYVEEGDFGLSFDSLEPPEAESLTQVELDMVDKILKKQKNLWMSTPSDNECLVYDLSDGYQGLLKQNIRPNESGELEDITIQTAKIDGFGVVYYIGDDTVFSLWVDLEKQRVSGANWFSFPPDEGFWINPQDRAFIDKSLSKSNSPFLSFKSLQEILNTNSLQISIVDDGWWLRVSPRSNPRTFIGFSIDKETGELGVPVSGH